jgi:hypothetical protein
MERAALSGRRRHKAAHANAIDGPIWLAAAPRSLTLKTRTARPMFLRLTQLTHLRLRLLQPEGHVHVQVPSMRVTKTASAGELRPQLQGDTNPSRLWGGARRLILIRTGPLRSAGSGNSELLRRL